VQKKRPVAHARVSYTDKLPRSRAAHGAVSRVHSPPEEAHSSRAGSTPPVRTRAGARSRAAPTHVQFTEEDEDSDTTQSSAQEYEVDELVEKHKQVVYTANAKVMSLNEQIVKVWQVGDITEVFPRSIWPNPGTEWKVDILKRFLNMATLYPGKKNREKITTRFADLCQTRRSRPNAKTQWSSEDMNLTEAWANDHCRPLRVSNQLGKGPDLSSSQRQRKPGLIQVLNKGKQKAGWRNEASVRKKPRRDVYEILSDELE